MQRPLTSHLLISNIESDTRRSYSGFRQHPCEALVPITHIGTHALGSKACREQGSRSPRPDLVEAIEEGGGGRWGDTLRIPHQ